MVQEVRFGQVIVYNDFGRAYDGSGRLDGILRLPDGSAVELTIDLTREEIEAFTRLGEQVGARLLRELRRGGESGRRGLQIVQ
jgi:hypothetical protein